MIEFLSEWLVINAGRAPVWVALSIDGAPVDRTMTAIDATGIILQSGTQSTAYPWHTIYRVTPKTS